MSFLERGSSTDSLNGLNGLSFTCEVCKISVRSAQKLMDHVKFSPLHKAAMQGSDRYSNSSRRTVEKLLYDGSKLFWRIGDTLDLCICENVAEDTIIIRALQNQSHVSCTIQRKSLLLALQTPGQIQWKEDSDDKKNEEEQLVQYILHRLHARRKNKDIILSVEKNPEELYEPVTMSCDESMSPNNDTLPQRNRRAKEEIQVAQKQVKDATSELRHARLQAECLSKMTRKTLDNFDSRFRNGPKSEWLQRLDRVMRKARESEIEG